MKSLRKFLWIAVLLMFLGSMYYGIRLGDFEEVRVNGSALCLSCIGIG